MEVENGYIWKVAIIGGVKNPWLWQEGYTKLIPAISSVLWFFQTNGSNRHVMRSAITTQTKQRHFCGKQISFLNFPGFWILCHPFSCICHCGISGTSSSDFNTRRMVCSRTFGAKKGWCLTLTKHLLSIYTPRFNNNMEMRGSNFAICTTLNLKIDSETSKIQTTSKFSHLLNQSQFVSHMVEVVFLIFQTPGLRRLGRLSLRQVSWSTKKICDRFFSSSHQQLWLPSHCCRSVLWGDPGHVTKANGDSDWQISTRNNPTKFPSLKDCMSLFLSATTTLHTIW